MSAETSNERASGLVEVWRSTVPGTRAHAVATDSASDCLLIADGWGVSFAALRLHRLSLSTGAETTSIRTRHQAVGALGIADERVFVATSKRLLQLGLEDLSIVAEWDRGLIANTQKMVLAAARVVMANWRAPTIGVFDPSTGVTKRVRVGSQPLLIPTPEGVLVAAGFDGVLSTLDTSTGRLAETRPSIPMTSALAMGLDVWCVPAVPASGGDGDPSVWVKHGSDRLVRIVGAPATGLLSGRARRLFADVARHVLWCITGDSADHLDEVDSDTGQIIATFSSAAQSWFCHVDPRAGMAFALARDATDKSRDVLTAYRLPPHI